MKLSRPGPTSLTSYRPPPVFLASKRRSTGYHVRAWVDNLFLSCHTNPNQINNLDPLLSGVTSRSFLSMEQSTLFTPQVLDGPRGECALSVLRDKAVGCQRCEIHRSRRQVVFGLGNPDSPRVAFVGEAPGEKEDETGQPMVGPAGQLLTKMIESGLRWKRADVFITNAILCRPVHGRNENRTPTGSELRNCREHLVGQLRAVRPKIIVLLGLTAAKALLNSGVDKTTLKSYRGKWWKWEGIPARVTFHPSFLLREPGSKNDAWKDLQEVLKLLKQGEKKVVHHV